MYAWYKSKYLYVVKHFNLLFNIFRVFNKFIAKGHGIILAVWTDASIFSVSACTVLQYNLSYIFNFNYKAKLMT